VKIYAIKFAYFLRNTFQNVAFGGSYGYQDRYEEGPSGHRPRRCDVRLLPDLRDLQLIRSRGAALDLVEGGASGSAIFIGGEMQIGFNFTLNGTLSMVQQMIENRQIDYVELLIDNFLHLPPAQLADSFDCPVAFHMMLSKYLENDRDALEKIAKRVRVFIDAMNPVYVSDHILCFSHNGRHLYHLGEIDYLREYGNVRQRVEQWQDLLGTRLYLENYPSIMDGAWDAPAFYERLSRETGAGVLFDASNAICAQHNSGAPVELWTNVIETTRRFHVAGYGESFIEPRVKVDSHDREMADDTLDFLSRMRRSFDKPGATITYERDFEIDYESISVDLQRLRDIFPSAGEELHVSAAHCAG
jgi:methanobactin biosynthesis cassette protein MbnB